MSNGRIYSVILSCFLFLAFQLPSVVVVAWIPAYDVGQHPHRVPSASSRSLPQSQQHLTQTKQQSPLFAGGFEWHDPSESFDQQGVENPYKNPQLLEDGSTLKIDPARLLSPRLNGINLYLIGMMGTGKSSVGRVVAKRKFCLNSRVFIIPGPSCPQFLQSSFGTIP